jgi:cell division protein FtsQ
LRKSDVISKGGTEVLEAPEERYVSESSGRRGAASSNRKLRRDLSEDFADPYEDEDDRPVARRRAGVRVRFRGLPATKWGRIFAACGLVVVLGMGFATYLMAKSYLLHDERFVIPSSSAIEFDGNVHVTRAQLLGIFGGDVDRNIFTVSLDERRAELERLPWVANATVMRLLPNRMRVSIGERTPVAFVRQGNRIGLVDANGVLLDMPVDAKKSAEHYSFPVVTGIASNEPLSTRAARMRIYARFTSELDGSGEKISEELSEVDLSNPEDVKATIPDHSSEILVHFGDEDFLNRYRKFKEHLPEWRTTYPKLSSVDMRYERQVVLETGSPATAVPADVSAANTSSASVANDKDIKPAGKPGAKPVEANAKPVAKKNPPVVAHKAAAKPVAKAPVHVVAQSEVAFDVPSRKAPPKGKKPAPAIAQSHPQVVHP